MTEREHYLTITKEECFEISEELFTAGQQANKLGVRLSKSLRFGDTEIQEGQPFTNAERVSSEADDLRAMLEVLEERGTIPPSSRERIEAKKLKVQRYLQVSQEQGTLTTDSNDF